MPLEVVLDTNILIFISEGKFNIQTEIERLLPQHHKIIILSASLRELELLARKKKKMKKHLDFALKLVEIYTLIDYNPKKISLVDDIILSYASNHKDNSIVITNDLELKNKLRNENLPVIFVRTFGHLELHGNIH